MSNTVKEVVKSGAIIGFITSLLLFIGFISKFAENRVLGIQFDGFKLNSYIEQSGRFFLQTFQAIYKLFDISTLTLFQYINVN